MSDIIQLLPDAVANQIAAGEVIQRPASAVKELLENAIDAGSSSIEVFVRDSGKTLLQVTDNGCGMSATDARMSFERHATSKIRSADDLFSIRTMGFRGEALASIAAVAQVELKTKRSEEEVGTLIQIEGSSVKLQEPAALPDGTTFSIKNLFYNIPARRNFLKSNPVEGRHILDEFERVALAHPQVALSLNLNGTEQYRLPISNLRQRIVNLYGSHYNERLVPVQEETTLLKVQGFVGKPEFSKKSRGEQFFFVNNRFIKDPYLHHAVSNAFQELLPADSYPSYWIYIDIDPSHIDVNIHPTKTEIKFDDERSVYAIIRASVKRSLGQYSVAPSLDFERETSFEVPHSKTFSPAVKPGITVNTDYNPFRKEARPASISGWEKLYEGLDRTPQDATPYSGQGLALPETEKGSGSADNKVLFQLSGSIIVCDFSGAGLLLIDQQSAHERILFERFMNAEPSNVSQHDLFPVTLEFSSRDSATLEELLPELVAMGFDLRAFGKNSYVLHSRPVLMETGTEHQLLEQLIESYRNTQEATTDELRRPVAKAAARSLSIKRGRKLEQSEMSRLVEDLLRCDDISLGIDGKPCSWVLTKEEIFAKMRRSV
ncbi:MAG: mismatch repair protein mutL [Bacteroidota bacterium]|jgi:DNA mismatch repair protein MutL